jgi:hypothetical protein
VGQNETISVSLTNDFTKPSTVNYTGLPTLPNGPALSSVAATVDLFPPPPVCGYPTLGSYVPAYIVVYDGAGVPVQLTDSAIATISCLHAAGYSLSFNASKTITEVLSIGGVWTTTDVNQPWINATYSDFSPGNYTVIAFDPWGQLAELNFSVSPAANPITNAPKMLVNGSLYYADDITSDITIGFPGYSFFHNASVTFLGVRFETYCPPSYGGCPVPPGVTETTVTTMTIGAIRLNATFPDKSSEFISAPIGDDDYIFTFMHHTNPQAGVLIVYSEGFKAYLLVS